MPFPAHRIVARSLRDSVIQLPELSGYFNYREIINYLKQLAAAILTLSRYADYCTLLINLSCNRWRIEKDAVKKKEVTFA